MRVTIIPILSCLLLTACANHKPRDESSPQACLDLADSVWQLSSDLAFEFAKAGVDTTEVLATASAQLLSNKSLCFEAARLGPDYLHQVMVLMNDQRKMMAQGVLIGLETGAKKREVDDK